MSANYLCRPVLLPALLLVAFSQVGCSAFGPMFGAPLPTQPVEPQATCTVELRPAHSRAKTMDFPISEGTLLQQVAEESGAARRFSKMDAYVLRMGENGRRFQMKARWDRGDRQFSLDTDYAIQPGDRVVFMEDGSSMVGNVIDTVLGPLAGGG